MDAKYSNLPDETLKSIHETFRQNNIDLSEEELRILNRSKTFE